jgi:hypothetical protein
MKKIFKYLARNSNHHFSHLSLARQYTSVNVFPEVTPMKLPHSRQPVTVSSPSPRRLLVFLLAAHTRASEQITSVPFSPPGLPFVLRVTHQSFTDT